MPTRNPPVVLDARVVTGGGGGPDKTILNSPRFLRERGYEMVCAYLHPPHDPGFAGIVAKAQKAGAPLVAVPDRGPWDWRVVTALLKVCRERDVAVWHGHDYKTNLLGLVLHKLYPMRLVTTLHGWVERTARTPAYFRVDRLCLPWYEEVYAVSPDLVAAGRAAGVAKSRCVLLENGIDLDEYRPAAPTGGAKAALGVPPDALVVGGVGRLSPEKAFDALIRSVPALVGRGLDVHAVIVGEGGDRPRLEALARDLGVAGRVHLTGWRADVRAAFAGFDVFALPSLREGLPNVLLEAMALGVPAVATRIAGIPRVVTDGVDGLLIHPGQQAELDAALGTLLSDADMRNRLATAARATVEARYSFAARMDRLAGHYDRLLRRRAWAGPGGAC